MSTTCEEDPPASRSFVDFFVGPPTPRGSLPADQRRGGDGSNRPASLHFEALASQELERTGTRLSMGINLVLSAAGAGVLSFPFAFRAMGLAFGCGATVLCAVANVLTLSVLVHFTLRLDAAGRLHARTYEEVCLQLLGERAYLCAVWCIVLGTLGALTGFLIVIGDVGEPVLRGALGEGSFVASRGGIVLLFSALVVFPLSLRGSFSELACSSAVSVAAVLAVGAVVVQRGWGAPALEDGADGGVTLWWEPSWSILLGFPIAIFSLGCHCELSAGLVARMQYPCCTSRPLPWQLIVVTSSPPRLPFSAQCRWCPSSQRSARQSTGAFRGSALYALVRAACVCRFTLRRAPSAI